MLLFLKPAHIYMFFLILLKLPTFCLHFWTWFRLQNEASVDFAQSVFDYEYPSSEHRVPYFNEAFVILHSFEDFAIYFMPFAWHYSTVYMSRGMDSQTFYSRVVLVILCIVPVYVRHLVYRLEFCILSLLTIMVLRKYFVIIPEEVKSKLI